MHTRFNHGRAGGRSGRFDAQSLMEGLESRQLLAGDVAASWGGQIGSFYVPGEQVKIQPQITNVGDAVVQGSVTLRVYITTDGVVDGDAIQVLERTGLNVTITPGSALTRNEAFTVPSDLAPGSYILVAKVFAGGGVSNPNTANDEAQFGGFNVAWRFGFFNERQNVILRVTDADGTVATFSAKNVSGLLTPNLFDPSKLDLFLQSGSASGSVKMTASGGDGFFDIAGLDIQNDVGTVDLGKARLIGDATIHDAIKSLKLGAVVGDPNDADAIDDGLEINIDALTGTPELRFGIVSDVILNSNVGLKLIDVECWRDFGSINENYIDAPFIVKAVSRCKWAPAMNLTGASKGLSLGSLSVPGEIFGEFWQLAAGMGKVTAGSILDTSMNVVGAINSITTIGNINGATIAGASLNTLNVGVSLLESKVLIGADLGLNNHLDTPPGSVDDEFAAGRIKSVTITLDMIDSIVAAGINPNAGTYLDGEATVVGGLASSIDKIVVNGVITNARFMAGKMAKTARVAGVNVPTLLDIRFQLPDFDAPTFTSETGTAGVLPFQFFIVWRDNVGLDITSIQNSDLIINGPALTNSAAVFIGGSANNEGTVVSGLYQVSPPGGDWEPSENGVYTVSIAASKVKDRAGNFAPEGVLGQFEIRVTQTPIASLPGPTQGTHGTQAQDNSGNLHFTFVENGQVFYRKITVAGLVTTEAVSPIDGTSRAVIALKASGTPVIIIARVNTVSRYDFDGASWVEDELSTNSPGAGITIKALSAVFDTTDRLHVAYYQGVSDARPTPGTTGLLLHLSQSAEGVDGGVDLVADLQNLSHVGTAELGLRSFQMVTDNANKVHIIFTAEFTDAAFPGTPSLPRSVLLYTSNVTGFSFSAPQVVAGVLNGKNSGDAGLGASIAIHPLEQQPYIAGTYLDRDSKGVASKASLRYYKLVNNAWTFTTVVNKSQGFKGSGDRGAGAIPTLAFDALGRPNIAFADFATVKEGAITRNAVGQVRHAILLGTKWTITTIFAQFTPSFYSISNIGMTIRNGRIVFSADAESRVGSNALLQSLVAEIPTFAA